MLHYEQFLKVFSKHLKDHGNAHKAIKKTVFKGLQTSFSGFGEDLPLGHQSGIIGVLQATEPFSSRLLQVRP